MGKKKKKTVTEQMLYRIRNVDEWSKSYLTTQYGYKATYKCNEFQFVEEKQAGTLHYYLNGVGIGYMLGGTIKNIVAHKAKPIPQKYQGKADDISGDELKSLPQIGMKNFVVRRNVFKCRFNGHKVQNIEAAVSLIKKGAEAQTIFKRVSAGFCPVCNTYFIMQSTYEKLKNVGIPCCRIVDSKTYEGNGSVGTMDLANESILMQYGYNVNQNEALSERARHKILALMIDNGILSKSEIIGYLDFFISQRQSNSKYEMAISKWEIDADFVRDYREGHYEKYGVNAIYR